MALVQRLTIVRVHAQPYLFAVSAGYFSKPVRIGQRLPGESYDVSSFRSQTRFGLLEIMDTPCRDHRRHQPLLPERRANPCRCGKISTKRPDLIGVIRRHALVAAAACVRIRSFAHLRLLRVVKLPATRQRQKVHACPRKLDTKMLGVTVIRATWYAFVREKPTSNYKVVTNLGSYPRVNL